ncbi:hypothetical protein [Nitrosomonas sp. wSCUT-2]
MPRNMDLFTDETSEVNQQPQTSPPTSLKLTVQDNPLSPAQQQFNKLLERIEKLKKQLNALQQMCDAHRPVYLQKMTPLRQQYHELMRKMVLWLDQRLQRKGWTAAQKRTAVMILCDLSFQLAVQGDVEMKAFHDKHSAENFDEKERAAASELHDAMKEMFGESFFDEESMDSFEDVFRAGMERAREIEAAEQEAHQDRKRKKKPNAAQLKAQAEQADAQSTLRMIFRQLASVLHPDRETDPEQRARKNTLMSEANAAYERSDLIELLKIQLRIELTSTDAIAKMAEEKLSPLTLLLKQQMHGLQNELHNARQKARQEFGLDRNEIVNVYNLSRKMIVSASVLERELDSMEYDFQHINDDKYFKRWLKSQERSMADLHAETMLSGWPFDPFEQE